MSEKKPFQLQVRYILLPLLIALIVYAVYLANYLGAFKSVMISEKTAGPFHLVFKTHIGPYHKINEDLASVEDWARSQNLSCQKSFGEYLDNPETVDEKRLRANVGCVLEAPATSVPPEFQQKTLEPKKYVVAQFEGASSIGPIKVYPRVKEFFQKMKYQFPESSLEIYEIKSQSAMTTEYFFAPN